jgi:phage-related protein
LEAAISLITQLAGGIVQSIPLAINAIGELLTGLKNAVFEWFSQARQWGVDLIKNFIEGIKSKIGDLKNAVGNVASGVKKMIGFSEPEEGPLSNFHTYAPDMMDLFASGIKSNAKNVFSAVGDVADGIYDSFQTAPALEIAGGYGTMNADAGMSDGGSDDIITAMTDALMNMQLVVNIGNKPIEAMITNAQQKTTYRSGGR